MEIEDDPDFSKLPAPDRELHLWWAAHTRDHAPGLDDMLTDCIAQADAIVKDQTYPLGGTLLVDVSANWLAAHTPQYAQLQTELLALSENSKEMVAENSGHFVIIDRPMLSQMR